MTEWARQIEYYVDVDQVGGNYSLLSRKTEDTAPVGALMQGDILPVHIYFRQRQASVGVATLPITLPSAATIVISGKKSGSLKTGDPLFAAGAFVETGSGDDLHYVSLLDLSDAAIESALGNEEQIDVKVDIEVQPAGSAEPSTFRFNVVLYRQAYDGETAPTAGLYRGVLVKIDSATQEMVFLHTDGTEYARWPKP
jgi:hypothetical protein